MADFRIRVDLAELLNSVAVVNATVFPLLSQAVEGLAQRAAEDWSEAVYRAKLWSGEKDAYVASLSYRMTGDFSAEVEATYKNAEAIETGRPAYDLKQMLSTSMKVRNSKRGRYLIIPFRHQTPGADAIGRPMPAAIYAQAKELGASAIALQGRRASGTGAYDIKTRRAMTVTARKYLWGDALPAGLAPKMLTRHHSDPYAGMHRFQTGKGSSYISFRLMGEWQTGAWIIGAREGLYLARAVSEALQPKAEAAFQQAVRLTMKAA